MTVSDCQGPLRTSGYRQEVAGGVPVAVVSVSPDHLTCPQQALFDGSGSYYPKPELRMVSCEGDLHYDGTILSTP